MLLLYHISEKWENRGNSKVGFNVGFRCIRHSFNSYRIWSKKLSSPLFASGDIFPPPRVWNYHLEKLHRTSGFHICLEQEEVSRCRTRGVSEESIACRRGSMRPRINPDITRSPKQEYQWPHRKDWYPPKFKKKSTAFRHTLKDISLWVERSYSFQFENTLWVKYTIKNSIVN